MRRFFKVLDSELSKSVGIVRIGQILIDLWGSVNSDLR
jgi:hypothetical protein